MGREVLQSARRIVIKVGSAVLADERGLDPSMISDLSSQMARLVREGREVVLVSSGAVAAGKGKLPEHAFPRTVPEKQALAAVGQGRLMHAYEEAFDRHGISVAQILLTREGLISRVRYRNAKNTFRTLLDWGIVPIVNENDTVATEELQFTDNDQLATVVVNLVEAELLVCLSDIDGLYDRDPREHGDARLIPEVAVVNDDVLALAGEKPGRAGRGGMRSKLLGARMVTACGVPMVIVGGRTPSVLARLFGGDCIGTFFRSTRRRISGRKPWIALTLAREGRIELDPGAVKALLDQGKSLLPVGITGVDGEFEHGACVVCLDREGREIAIGISNYSSAEIRKLIGCKTSEISGIIGHPWTEEVIHRDNLVVLWEP